jgi:hypothetical protein
MFMREFIPMPMKELQQTSGPREVVSLLRQLAELEEDSRGFEGSIQGIIYTCRLATQYSEWLEYYSKS